ncbi:unnamed protein product [Hymenolepis diminuta]|uniref:Protein kinase domain-containing protein n=1 Tax=Hymenolepis diminuta TaxID=6216 RepID=A0A0R3S9K4_HYMDI|nr:unnamed protein product [Hymenolepis diminuta]
MAYEPVLAPSIVTGESSLTVSGDSGFRHYLRTISTSLTPNNTPTTPKTISTAFFIPQSETVNNNTHSSALNEFPACITSKINQPDSGSMTTLALPNSTTTDSDNVFHENGISSFTFSSSFESPHTSLNSTEEAMHKPVRSPPERSTPYHTRSHVNVQRGGQSMSDFLNKLFRRRVTSTGRYRDNSRSQIINPHSLPVQSATSLTKETTAPKAIRYSEDRVIRFRSIGVSADHLTGTYSCTEPVTVTRNPKSSKPILRTTCLQAEFSEPCLKSAPPYLREQRISVMSIGKVETTSLPSIPHSVERSDKCTSPLPNLLSFNESPIRSNVPEIGVKRQPPVPTYWYRDDQDSTRLSTQVDLESDTSLQQSDESLTTESGGLYELVIKKLTHAPSQNGDLQRSTPVRISKCQSETTQKVSDKSSVEGSEFTVTQNYRGGEEESSSYNWLSVKNNTPSKCHLPSAPNLRNQKGIREECTPTEDIKVNSRNSDQQSRKPSAKSPPSVILRRNRDIANGVQSPVSPHHSSLKSKRILSVVENRTNFTSSRFGDRKFSQPVILDYHQNSSGESCSTIQSNFTDSLEDRIRPISDNDTSRIMDIGGSPITPKFNNKDMESPNMTNKDKTMIKGNPTSLELGKSIQVGESNSSDSSGIGLHFTAPSSVNTSIDLTTVPSQMSQQNEQLKKRRISSTKAEMGLTPPQLLEFETSDQKNTKPSNSNGLLVVKEESEQGSYDSARSSIISSSSIENTTTKPDSQEIQRPKLEGDSNKTSVPINRPQNLALKTNYTKMTILPSPTEKVSPSPEISNVTSNLSRLPPSPTVDTLPTSSGSDKSPALQKHTKSPKPLHLQTPDHEKTPVCKKSPPTSPVSQIFFPKSVKRFARSPTETPPSPIKITEKPKGETVVLTNEGTIETAKVQENKTKNTLGSTKLTRSSQVTKRPQTVSASTYNDNAQKISVVHPETHKNVKPDCHFVIREKVGGGKFGSVFRCENKETHQILAMKEIKTDRLVRHTSGDIMEVAVLRAIGHHENIACLHSVYEIQRTCFIVTEYVSGGALFDRVVSENNLDEQISASIVSQMLLGLQHIQTCSILHLDLKPENIMMVAPTGYQLKIIDFGVAYFYDPKCPKRQMGGTYIYSAPETINYEIQSFATDIWSVAVIAYELLSGITPFECPPPETPDKELTMPEVTTNIINCRYNFDDDGICDASEKAKDFIRMILKKNPKDRPSVKECLEHPWMKMSSELPKVRREVSIRRQASVCSKSLE